MVVLKEPMHRFVKDYGHRRGSWIPEACAVILQVEALKHLQGDSEAHVWAVEFHEASGDGHFWKLYDEHGFAPFRAIYAEMRKNIGPVIGNRPADWNEVWRRLKLPFRVAVP